MKRFLRTAALGAALVTGGLGGSCMMMGGSSEDLSEHMNALAASMDEHRTEMGSLADLEAVSSSEALHAARMEALLDELGADLGRACSCMSGGASAEGAEMADALDAIRAEHEAHRSAMDAAADLDGARAEEARHEADAGEMLDSMRASHDQMMAGGGCCSCCGH